MKTKTKIKDKSKKFPKEPVSLLNAHTHLQSQGWLGPGHSLHASASSDPVSHADKSRGLSRPLLVTNKQDSRGIGSKTFNATDQWWLNAFDKGLKALPDIDGKKRKRKAEDTEPENEALGELHAIRMGTKKYTRSEALYGRFVQGEGLEGTIVVHEARLRGGAGETERRKKKKKKKGEEVKAGIQKQDVEMAEPEPEIEEKPATDDKTELRRERKLRRKASRALEDQVDDIKMANADKEAAEKPDKSRKKSKKEKEAPLAIPAPKAEKKKKKKKHEKSAPSPPPEASASSSASVSDDVSPDPLPKKGTSPLPLPPANTFTKPAKPSNKSKLTLAIEPHPLEKAFKNPADHTAQPFKFFDSADVAVEDNSDLEDSSDDEAPSSLRPSSISLPPLTPHTQLDHRARAQRSAAPTPDTAALGKFFPREGPPAANLASAAAAVAASSGATSAPIGDGKGGFDAKEFEKQFWEKRGETNRAWKARRREVGKQARRAERRGGRRSGGGEEE